MSTRHARPAAPNPRPLPPLAQRVPSPARRLDAVLRAGALERAPLGDAATGGLPVLAGGAMAGKILFDYLNMPDDVYGRTAWQRHEARWVVDRGGFTLINALNACVNDGDMSIEETNAILNQLYAKSITSVEDYLAYAEANGKTNNHFYHKLVKEWCSLHPDECPPTPPPPLRPQYSDYDTRPRFFGDASSPPPPRPPPLRPQHSAPRVRLF